MNIPLSCGLHLRFLASTDAAPLHKLIAANRERLADSFPILLSSTSDVVSALQYVQTKLREMKERTFYSFVLADEREDLFGYVSLKNVDWSVPKAEVAYYIDRGFEGKGITSEALEKVCRYAFDELGINKLFLRVSPGNPGSRRVAEKCGFEKEGLLRSDFKTSAGELIDVEYFGRVRQKPGSES